MNKEYNRQESDEHIDDKLELERMDELEPLIIHDKDKKKIRKKHGKKREPFGCCFFVIMIIIMTIADIITERYDLERGSLRKLTMALFASIYGIIYFLIDKIRK